MKKCYINGELRYEEVWRRNGSLDHPGAPSRIYYYPNKKVCQEKWLIEGYFHRKDHPANIEYYKNGKRKLEQWFLRGILHRSSGPAEIKYHKNGKVSGEKWVLDGKLHRTDGPSLRYFKEDGTVFSEIWCQQDVRHRLNGPAHTTLHDGYPPDEAWYINGSQVKPFFSQAQLIQSCLKRLGVVPQNVCDYINNEALVKSITAAVALSE